MPAVVGCTEADNRDALSLDNHAVWSELQFAATRPGPAERSWRLPAALVVGAMHALALIGLASTRFSAPPVSSVPLQISFITRPAPTPSADNASEPVAPVRASRRQRPAPALSSPTIEVNVEAIVPSATPLRLHLTNDPWQLPDTPTTPNVLQKAYVDRLPGRDEAYVEGIALHEELTPQKIVAGIGAMLFGAIKVDPCEPARRRLANRGTRNDADSIAADLRTLEQQCRP